MKIRRNINFTIEEKNNNRIKKTELATFRWAVNNDIAMKSHEDKQENKKDMVKNPSNPLPIAPKVDEMEVKVKEIASKKELKDQLIKFLVINGRPKAMELMTKIVTIGIEQAYLESPSFFNLVDKFWTVKE